MKYLNRILGAVALTLISTGAWATNGTPTPRPSSSATITPATAATPVKINAKDVGSSASFSAFTASGSCLVDPPAIPNGSSTDVTCSVVGVKMGDVVKVSIMPSAVVDFAPWNNRDCWIEQAAWARPTGDAIRIRFINRDYAQGTTGSLVDCDPQALTINYEVTRPNPSP